MPIKATKAVRKAFRQRSTAAAIAEIYAHKSNESGAQSPDDGIGVVIKK